MKLGFVTVGCEYSRIVGPRAIQGGVTLKFEPAGSFEFTSAAVWPTGDDFTRDDERGVRAALGDKGAEQTSCKLVALKWDSISSCSLGFETASRLATLAAFETSLTASSIAFP
jgi:hypothetical protein